MNDADGHAPPWITLGLRIEHLPRRGILAIGELDEEAAVEHVVSPRRGGVGGVGGEEIAHPHPDYFGSSGSPEFTQASNPS